MKKFLIKIIATFVAAISLFAFTGCKPVDDLALITNRGTLIVGITDYEPMDYKDPVTGDWIGFDAELAKMFAAELGVNVQFVEIDWDSKVAELKSKNIDLIWNGMTASKKLGRNIDFSIMYAKNAQVAVTKTTSNITTKAQVEAAKIAVESGSAGNTVATELGIPAARLAAVDTQLLALVDVVSGNSDVAIIDITMAQSVVGKNNFSGLQIVSGVSYGEELFAVGLRKRSNIKETLDAFLKAKYADGTMAQLIEKYPVGLNVEALV